MDSRSERALRKGFTLVELLVVIAIIGILIGMLLPAVQQVREAARRIQCANNSRQLSLASMNFESAHMHFPAGWTAINENVSTGEALLPGWAWSAQLLPFIEQQNLSDATNFNASLTDISNEETLTQVVNTFICPSDPDDTILDFADDIPSPVGGGSGTRGLQSGTQNQSQTSNQLNLARSNYSGVFGSIEIEDDPFQGNGVFFGNSSIGFRDIRDGSSNTIIIGERRNDRGGVTWLGVVPGISEPFARVVGATDHSPNDPGDGFEDFRSYHSGGINVALGDGSTQFIPDTTSEPIFQALGSRAGGEIVSF